MKLPDSVREQFRRHGRAGGRARSARLSAGARRAIAHRAAAARWIRARFGAASFEELGLPGGEIVDAGLADLAAGRVTAPSLLVSLAAPRLRREGIPVSRALEDPEERLYALLSEKDGDLAHARYGAHLRQIASFADACRTARTGKKGRRRAS
jgi:hypothetical protein